MIAASRIATVAGGVYVKSDAEHEQPARVAATAGGEGAGQGWPYPEKKRKLSEWGGESGSPVSQ
jgi:hypothetical protein